VTCYHEANGGNRQEKRQGEELIAFGSLGLGLVVGGGAGTKAP
jgi:hypothetical protein